MTTTMTEDKSLAADFKRITSMGPAERLALAKERTAAMEATNPELAALMRQEIAKEEAALNAPKKPEPPKQMSGNVPLLPSTRNHPSSTEPPTSEGGPVNVLRHLLLLHEGMTAMHAQHTELQRIHHQHAAELSEVRKALTQINNHNITTGKLVAELHSALHSTPK